MKSVEETKLFLRGYSREEKPGERDDLTEVIFTKQILDEVYLQFILVYKMGFVNKNPELPANYARVIRRVGYLIVEGNFLKIKSPCIPRLDVLYHYLTGKRDFK